MRGPLFSGPIGHRATLERVAQIAKARPPTVVLSASWLAAELAEVVPVVLLIESDAVAAGRRAMRKALQAGRPLLMVAAGDRVPLGSAAVGTLVLEGLTEVDAGETSAFLLGLAPSLKPDGVIVALDNTKEPYDEARLGGELLAAGFVGIAQERPREGALLTIGRPPAESVLRRRRAAPGVV